MISLIEYFGKFMDHVAATEERMENAAELLERVDKLMALALDDGIHLPVNPVTNSQVSGIEYGGF
jgi:hypothetical protein